jgi:hypothetical protein
VSGFFRRVIAASRPRPWLTVDASSPLGRLILALRRDNTYDRTTTPGGKK